MLTEMVKCKDCIYRQLIDNASDMAIWLYECTKFSTPCDGPGVVTGCSYGKSRGNSCGKPEEVSMQFNAYPGNSNFV